MDAMCYIGAWSSVSMGFNPRARDGRDFTLSALLQLKIVSIHAPVMDAIDLVLGSQIQNLVSIHAPVMDAILSMSY